MLQFANRTGLAGTIFASPDPEGIDTLYAVMKGTFDLNGDVRRADEQLPVTLAAEHYGDPLTSSIRVPDDVGLIKPATDVLLIGSAYAPGGRPANWMDVSLSVGSMHKFVRVFGDRRWEADGLGYRMSAPAPFKRMPLVWERAFGGWDESDAGPAAEARNPVGLGYRIQKGGRPIDGLPVANLEDPYLPITSWEDSPAPACFAPVAPHWKPRSDFAGTYDDRWQRQRAPYLPDDFDSRFFQVAPAGLTAPGYLQGGETVEVRGATPDGYLGFTIPDLRVQVTFIVAGQPQERVANLDTVIVDADAARLVLLWRCGLACDKKLLRVSEVRAEPDQAA
jgi:hypothetical protein